jgi:uncharacterized repeat protein (TIGR01451 family)
LIFIVHDLNGALCHKQFKSTPMKNLFKTLLVLLICSFSFQMRAQTSVTITGAMDSTFATVLCNPPVDISCVSYGNTTGYNSLTDSLDIHVFFGDGQDSIFTVAIYESGGIQYWYAEHVHSYSAGTFNWMVIATGPDGMADTVYASPITITASCTTVDGYVYYDNNSNCIFDAGDAALAGIGLHVTNGTPAGYVGTGYTDASGHYTITIPQGLTGLQISPYMITGASVTCPASGSYTFNSTSSTTLDFGLTCSASTFDLLAQHSFSGVGAPGSNGQISFYAGNHSCTPQPAVIELTLDPAVSYVSMLSGPAPTSIAGNVLTWNLTLSPTAGYWGTVFVLDIYTATTATVFDPAVFNVNISPLADANPSNNSDTWTLIIGGPYDPNNKEVIPAGTGAGGNVAPNTEFRYTINFQNTGTAPANNIYVLDTISENLDMTTFEILSSSHTMQPYFFADNLVRFDFPNIMLPDSNANEPMSHGWVIYKIKAKSGLPNLTEIRNTAYIYFDYNAPIVTNTTLNTIDMSIGINEQDDNSVANKFFPNPTYGPTRIDFGQDVSGTVMIIDITGKVVLNFTVNTKREVELDLGMLAAGLYKVVVPGLDLKNNTLQLIK